VVPQAFGTVHEALDMRLVHGVSRRQLLRGRPVKNTGGRAAFWLRIPGGARVAGAADLALVGDTVPAAFASATGQPISGNSLDNTIRVGTLVWTEWVLVDVQVHALADGYGHGIAHLWAEDGTLLGTASQSAVVRTPPP
jgi:acyl-CoA thioesterase